MATKIPQTIGIVQTLKPRPPIVAILGHVDHGKTSLLDTIRKTSVTASEAGGITQHIGAYQIKIKNQKSKIKTEDEKSITFIDTPGHEAFIKMRARGAQAADIAVLVVAANDGVMPQTKESISIIKKAQVPFIVAVNKIDLPDADIEKVKQQLTQNDVLVEGFGGDIVLVPVSAKTGKGIPELLDVLSLIGEMKELAADPGGTLTGVVVEAKLDKRKGVLATVIVKNGSLKTGDTLYAETIRAKIRAMSDAQGKMVAIALPSMPVEILGWEAVPSIGATVSSSLIPQEAAIVEDKSYAFELPPVETTTKLKVILKTDVVGSLEAIRENLPELVDIVSAQTGEIGEADVLLAKSTDAFIIGFQVKVTTSAQKLATVEKVKIKVYTIIYQLLEEIGDVIELLNQPEAQEQALGEVQILVEFKFGDERVAGGKVTSGRIVRNDLIKILRKDEEIGRGRIKSIRHGKEDAPKMETPGECGILFDKKLDFKIGDSIIAYKLHELLA